MKQIKNIYLSGLGAIGSTYAGMLSDMNPECIKIIASEDRIRLYNDNGVLINGKKYEFKYINPGEKAEPADLILIAVKQHHLEQSIKDIRNFVGQNTIILSLLNGISSEEIIGREFGMDKMLYSFCVGTDAVRTGTHTQYTKHGRIVFGEAVNEIKSQKVEAVATVFKAAGIPYSIPVDMIRELWWKFMLNVGINQVSAILKAPYGIFHNVDEARDLMVLASKEVILLANKMGINLNDEDINEYIKIIKTLSPEGKTSMLQDIEAGRKTEVEIFSGTVIELGKKHYVQTPVNDILFKMIRALEKMQ